MTEGAAARIYEGEEEVEEEESSKGDLCMSSLTTLSITLSHLSLMLLTFL